MTARWRIVIVAALALVGIGFVPAGDDKPATAEGKKVKGLVAEVKKKAEAEAESLETLYKDLHSHPELSLQEMRSAGKLAEEMKKLGFKVTTRFGATGVVAVLENGKGPTVLVRTDMDALPVTEATGLAYASKARARDK